MIFNTGAALLDAIVLSVVAKKKKEPMVIKLHKMWEKESMFQNRHSILSLEDYKRWLFRDIW